MNCTQNLVFNTPAVSVKTYFKATTAMKLIFTKSINLFSLEQSHHKPICMYGHRNKTTIIHSYLFVMRLHQWNKVKATRGGLNANFHISCWPPLVALTIFAEPSQPYGPGIWWFQKMYGFSIVNSIDSQIIKKDCKRVQTTCWTPSGTLNKVGKGEPLWWP